MDMNVCKKAVQLFSRVNQLDRELSYLRKNWLGIFVVRYKCCLKFRGIKERDEYFKLTREDIDALIKIREDKIKAEKHELKMLFSEE